MEEGLEMALLFIEAILFDGLPPGEEEATKMILSKFRKAVGLGLFPAPEPAEWPSDDDLGQELARLTVLDVVRHDQEPERRALRNAWREREAEFREGGRL